MAEPNLVAVVDDDVSVRDSLPELLRSFGFRAQGYASAEAFLRSEGPGQAGCLVLDVAMPVMSGPDLHQELRRRGRHIPVVFVTAHGSAEFDLAKLRNDAVAFLGKPFTEAAILDAVRAAFAQG